MVPTGKGLALLAAPFDPSVLLPGLYLAGALLVGAALIALIGRWRRRAEPDSPGPSEQLAHFRSLYERGLLSQEEFERLRALLGGQLRESLDVPPPPAPPETRPTSPEKPDSPPAGPPPPDAGIRPA
jgi:hypothetical protein